MKYVFKVVLLLNELKRCLWNALWHVWLDRGRSWIGLKSLLADKTGPEQKQVTNIWVQKCSWDSLVPRATPCYEWSCQHMACSSFALVAPSHTVLHFQLLLVSQSCSKNYTGTAPCTTASSIKLKLCQFKSMALSSFALQALLHTMLHFQLPLLNIGTQSEDNTFQILSPSIWFDKIGPYWPMFIFDVLVL